MMRSFPSSLDPGAPPLFASPGDVIAWVRAVDWLLAADRAVVLHVDDAADHRNPALSITETPQLASEVGGVDASLRDSQAVTS